MRRTVFFTMISMLVGCLLLATANREATAQSYELKFQSPYPPAHVTVKKAFEPWFETVAQKAMDS